MYHLYNNVIVNEYTVLSHTFNARMPYMLTLEKGCLTNREM